MLSGQNILRQTQGGWGGGVFKFFKMLNIPTRNQSVLMFKFTPPMRN